MIQLVCYYKPLHMEELYLMSADTVGKYVLYVNTHHCLRAAAQRGLAGVEKQSYKPMAQSWCVY